MHACQQLCVRTQPRPNGIRKRSASHRSTEVRVYDAHDGVDDLALLLLCLSWRRARKVAAHCKQLPAHVTRIANI